jgi:hypothetical protein
MLLDLNGSKVHVDIIEENSFVSKHTGASLSILKVGATIRGETANDEFLSLIKRAKDDIVVSVDENGKVQKQWKIGNTSWSYRQGSPIYQHTLELTEVEKLNLSALKLGDMTVHPYEYEETFGEEALTIEAKVSLPEAQHLQIKALQKSDDYFSVVRYGINDVPRQMRFGLCYWSQHNNEYKHQLVLVEESKEPNTLASAFRWIRPLRKLVADNTAVIESLLATLHNKNILTEEEVNNIRKDITDRSWDIWYGFFRVENIDKM